MTEGLLSVGVDVGTTTTQLIVSRLKVENRAGAFHVPEISITQRQILYRSPIHFTPLSEGDRIDGDRLRKIVMGEYEAAGIRRENVDTGAVIITGETSRKENAATVLQVLSDLAGELVVATAGPDLESVLAAQGSGAVDHSRQTGKGILHMDIGGGTSNLAWIRDGKILATGCLNVGGRLVKLDERGTITYVSPVLRGLTGLEPGQQPEVRELEALAELLTQALEMAAGLRPATELLNKLTTEHPFQFQPAAEGMVVSFSGGVADCIGQERQNFVFGDLGPILGKAIRKSRLCQSFILGEHTIRATVIGAGCHSTRLSGSTVFYRGISFPVRNLPVASVSDPTAQAVRAAVGIHDTTPILALPELSRLSYGALSNLAGELVKAVPQGPIYLSARQDMAKALGQALALRTDRPVLCLDRLELSQGSFLDVNPPVGPALPVVIKSLVFTP